MGVQQNLYTSYYNIFNQEYKNIVCLLINKSEYKNHNRVLQKSTVITIRPLDIVLILHFGDGLFLSKSVNLKVKVEGSDKVTVT